MPLSPVYIVMVGGKKKEMHAKRLITVDAGLIIMSVQGSLLILFTM